MEVTFISAFTAGLLSFLAPCVLPIVPGYLSYLTGVSALEEKPEITKTLIPVIFFVLGFSTVFISLGAGASFLGQFLTDNREIIAKIGGGIIVFFGLHFANLLIREDFLKLLSGIGLLVASLFAFEAISFETFKTIAGVWAVVVGLYLLDVHMILYKQVRKQNTFKVGMLGSFLVGLTFGAGWSPCIGPVLGSILLIASQQDSVWEGVKLLSFYSIGLGIPFVFAGLFWHTFMSLVRNFSRFFVVVEYTGGLLLIVMGLLVASGQLAIISSTLE